MRKLNIEYKKWKIKNDLKNFRKRRKKNKKRKSKRNLSNLFKKKSFKVPEIFSIIENPNETVSFFNDIISTLRNEFAMDKFQNDVHEIYINMSEVKKITGDALMYLLSIIRNTRGIEDLKIRWKGNFPNNEEIRKFLTESGFLHYMRTNSINLANSTEKYRIKDGTKFNCTFSNLDIRKEICDFTVSKIGKSKKELNFLFNILTEIITNIEHAYNVNNKDGIFRPSWYIMVENEDNKVKYTFLDNGFGIPTTVKKKYYEKFIKFLNLDKEYKYIESALDGSFKRSQTNKPERSTGLPDVYEKLIDGRISNLKIISNYAYYDKGNSRDIDFNIEGTIIYWEIIKEEQKC